MEQEVKDFFLSPATSTLAVYMTFDKGHGRIYALDNQIGWFDREEGMKESCYIWNG